MENIIWKPVVGYEGLYEVSNTGLVKSLGSSSYKFPHMLRTHMRKKNGYLCVQLCKNNIKKVINIHRLVAQAFIPNPQNLPIVNHKDENKQNNDVNNLEWCTVSYNSKYSLERHPERVETMAAYLVDKQTGENLSSWSKKGNPHKYHQRVAVVNEFWEPIEIYDNPATAANRYHVKVCNLLTACKKNKDKKFKHKTDGKIFVFIED